MDTAAVPPPPTNPEAPKAKIILQDSLYKRRYRARSLWNARYFVFTEDGVLRYYQNKDQAHEASPLSSSPPPSSSPLPTPKAQYTVNELPDCEISDLFVAKNGKQLLYCVKMTWSTVTDESQELDGESQMFSDVDSLYSAGGGEREQQQQLHPPDGDLSVHSRRNNNTNNNVQAHLNNPPSPNGNMANGMSPRTSQDRALRGSFLRRRRAQQKNQNNKRSASNNSIDDESLTFETNNKPQNNNNIRRQAHIREALQTHADEIPQIPTMVEVEPQQQPQPPPPAAAPAPAAATAESTTLTEEKQYLRAQFLNSKKESRKRNQRKLMEGTKLAAAAGATVGVAVMTAGVGLLAGLLFLGAAAGSSGAAITWGHSRTKRRGEMILASGDYEKMRRWKACLDAALESGTISKSKWGQLFVDGGKRNVALFPKSPPALPRSPRDDGQQRTVQLENSMNIRWLPLESGWASFLGTGSQGLRIFRQDRPRKSDMAVEGRPSPPVKSHIVLNASALDAFLCLMSNGRISSSSSGNSYESPMVAPITPNSGQRASFRILERVDDNTDVIHMVCSPLYLFPSWTTSRDFVLYRYWRHEEDGTFVVCYESVEHKDCPPHPDYCRGEMHQVFTIAPHKRNYRRKSSNEGRAAQECFMTSWVQVDPKGWVPMKPFSFLANQAYGDAFSVAALMQLLDIRDAIDQDRFVPVSPDEEEYRPAQMQKMRSFDLGEPADLKGNQSMESNEINEDMMNYDFAFATRESIMQTDSPTGFVSNPPPFFRDKWAAPDANSFRVRGKNYKVDRKKINAGPSIGRLIAVDVVHVDAPIYSGMTTHPTERLQLALEKEKALKANGLPSDLPPFIFCVNIVLPGPPFYHGVFYYAIDDMSKIDGTDGSPSSFLCRDFLFGESDQFRDKTFKLIPQIVEGNFIVRKAVGSTPAIMGKKLRQLYIRTERSFEVVLDCGSSPVATGVIRLSLGYAKTLVVDMGFLFESDTEAVLPERIFGCVRIRQPEFGPHILRKVLAPSPVPSTPTR